MAGETRTLRVFVTGDSKDAQKSNKKLANSLEDVDDAGKRADERLKDVDKTTTKLGDSFEDTGRKGQTSLGGIDTTALDKKLVETHQRLVDLNKEFARTGDVDLFKKIRKERSALNNLRRVRGELSGIAGAGLAAVKAGTELGAALGKGVADASKSLGAAKSALVAGIVAVGVAAAPLLSGVIAGAIVGAAGLGGVVGGVVIAASHPEVKAAATRTGELFKTTMQSAGVAFVPATLSALATINEGIRDMRADAQRALTLAARFVEPLTQGALGFIRNLMPGMISALEKGRPVIEELAAWGPRLGAALSFMLTKFSENAYEASRALSGLMTIVEAAFIYVTGLLSTLTKIYGWMEKFSMVITGNVVGLHQLAAAEKAAENTGDEFSAGLAEIAAKFGNFGSAASGASSNVESLSDAIDRLTRENQSAESAMLSAEEAIDSAAKAFKDNGKTLDANTAAGRANRQALLNMARAANDVYDATLKTTHSEEAAAAQAARYREALIAAARQMGASKAEAERYANQLTKIPPAKNTKADFKGDNTGVDQWKRKLDGIPRYIPINAELRDITNPATRDALRLGRLSKGGPVEGPGPKGVDSQPYLLAPGEHVLTAAEVDAAGGHAAIERLREQLRTGRGVPAVAKVADATVSRAPEVAAKSLAVAAGGNVYVTVHVAGSVLAEKDLARSIAPSIRDAIARDGRRNGGRTGL